MRVSILYGITIIIIKEATEPRNSFYKKKKKKVI